jgi:hypothetical protein
MLQRRAELSGQFAMGDEDDADHQTPIHVRLLGAVHESGAFLLILSPSARAFLGNWGKYCIAVLGTETFLPNTPGKGA